MFFGAFRQLLQDEIVTHWQQSGTQDENPWIVFTAGAMGAGKSHTRAHTQHATARVHTYTHMCVNICITHTHTHTHVYIYLHTHTHTHTHKQDNIHILYMWAGKSHTMNMLEAFGCCALSSMV